jgi:murein DD-endopeptidase MepM/ murein hydrolase activator NlpD
MDFRRFREVVFAVTCVFVLAVCVFAGAIDAAAASGPATKASSTWTVRANPAKLVNGGPILLEVTPPERLKSLTGAWLGHEIAFDETSGKTWFALAGVSLETKPGSYPLVLEGVTQAGNHTSFRRTFSVGHAKYPVIPLKVSKQFTEPSVEQVQVIKQDQELKHKTFSQTMPEREWSGRFSPPVDAPTSDVFGTRRVFNGATKSVHQGLDYRVGPGTPVSAVNAGTVILARPLYFEGNCVVVDHGQGLLSLYLHFSEIKVKEGDRVGRGQLLGLSGATGRATGPHLHIAVRWQGVYLNPAALLTLPLPESQAKLSPPAK